MRVTVIERTDTRVVVRLDPGWLARLRGAKPLVVELGRGQRQGSRPGTSRFGNWHARGTDRPVEDLPYARRILDAIDFVPVSEIKV